MQPFFYDYTDVRLNFKCYDYKIITHNVTPFYPN